MKDIKTLKESFRIINSKYVSSKKLDETSYQIAITYKNRNYILNINTKYKFIMISTTESIYGMNLNTDTLELINYIKEMVTFTEFENYNVFSFSCRKERIDKELYNALQVVNQMNEYDMIIDVEQQDTTIQEYQSEIIEYNYGLNCFDKRLFDENIFEDFNEKITTLKEEDLYLMYITLVSYFYKLINNMWKDEKIDPYIISDMLTIIYEEIQKRLKEQTYYEWFNELSNYFENENIEIYLNKKNKEKNKELK